MFQRNGRIRSAENNLILKRIVCGHHVIRSAGSKVHRPGVRGEDHVRAVHRHLANGRHIGPAAVAEYKPQIAEFHRHVIDQFRRVVARVSHAPAKGKQHGHALPRAVFIHGEHVRVVHEPFYRRSIQPRFHDHPPARPPDTQPFNLVPRRIRIERVDPRYPDKMVGILFHQS